MPNFIASRWAASKWRSVRDPKRRASWPCCTPPHGIVARGQGLVEYALILVLVAVVVIVVAALLGDQIQFVYCDIVISLSDNAPTIPACEAPRVTCSGVADGAHVSGSINMEAVVKDNKGVSTENIPRVDFYVDGNRRHTEYLYHYCMGSGGENGTGCSDFDISSLSSGAHTISAVATDADGYTGECSLTIYTP